MSRARTLRRAAARAARRAGIEPRPRLPLRCASYAEALAVTAEHFQGQLVHVVILHDDECPERYQRGACACSPEVVLEELTVDTYLSGQRGERTWRRPS